MTTNAKPAPHPCQPPEYEIAGTDPNSCILFKDVNIIDSTGADPYKGQVLIRGERIIYVGEVPQDQIPRSARIIEGRGRTLMSGLCDAHTHFTWNGGNLDALGEMGVEEHTILTMRSARSFLDSGYTMCFGAASAKERLDVVVRNAINAGDIPGPRYLANGKEIARRIGALVDSITSFADGPVEMKEVVEKTIAIGVDQIKLSMSGEELTEKCKAEETYFDDDEATAACETAHAAGKRVCSHARSQESIKLSCRAGVDVIYHASYVDEEGLDMLEARKDKIWVAPAINWIWATLYEASPFGYTQEKAEEVGYGKELKAAIWGMKEMKKRGIKILPGGDYGFAWTPHGTYARDLEHFVKLFGYTEMEAIIAATALGGDIMLRPHELGKVQPGYFADMILVNGDPLKDITILQDHDKLDMILINGRVHKQHPRDAMPAPPVAGQDGNSHVIAPDYPRDFNFSKDIEVQ